MKKHHRTTEAFVPDLDGAINKHRTVVWGRTPRGAVIHVQFLRISAEDYMTRVKEAHEQARIGAFLLALPYILLTVACLFMVPVITLLFRPPAEGNLWLTILLFFGILLIAPLSPVLRNANEERVNRRLEQSVKALEEQYTGSVQCHPLGQDASDLQTAMDHVTPTVRDSILASLDAGDQETALSTMQALRGHEDGSTRGGRA